MSNAWLRTVCWGLSLAVVAVLAASSASALGTPEGTVITNQATVNYTDVNGNPLSALSNVVSTTVSQVGGVLVDPDGAANADPGDTVYYAHTVTNTGNGDDTIDLTAVSSQGWAVAFFLDVDGDGLYNGAVDTPLADSDGDGTPDSGLLAADASAQILVAVTVPAGTADGSSDSTVVTGTSSFDTAVTETATDTTTIASPDLGVVKSVAPGGPQPPGTVLTYSVVITNNGSGQADSVVMTDPIPANTTYVNGSITLNGAPLTDAADADSGDYDVTNPGMVTVDAGSLAGAGGSATVTFQVRID